MNCFFSATIAVLALGCSSAPTPIDAALPADSQPDTNIVSMCCNESVNGSNASDGTTFDSVWLAWRYPPQCGFTARTIWVSSNVSAVAVLSDDGGRPGAVLLPETKASPTGMGSSASLTLLLSKGSPVWIAIKNVYPGSITDGSRTPFSNLGTPTDWAYTNQSLTAWIAGPKQRPAVFKVEGCSN